MILQNLKQINCIQLKLISEIILIICPTTLDKYVKLVPTLELREYVKQGQKWLKEVGESHLLKDLWDRLFEEDEEEKEFEDYEEHQEIIKKKHYSNGIRDQRIQVRVTKSEKEMIEKLAKIQYMDSSNFIRWLIFKKYIDDFIK